MFLLRYGRHVYAPRKGTYMACPYKGFINLADTLLWIVCEWKTAETWFLARLFMLQSSITSQILEFIYWTVTIFSFDHMTDENQEYHWWKRAVQLVT